MRSAVLKARLEERPDWHGQYQYGVPPVGGAGHPVRRKARPAPKEGPLCPVCRIRVGAAGEPCC